MCYRQYPNNSASSGQSMLGVAPQCEYLLGQEKGSVYCPFYDKFIASHVMAIVKVIDVFILVLPGLVLGNSIKDVGHVGLVSGRKNMSLSYSQKYN